jgi:O-antigen ligase
MLTPQNAILKPARYGELAIALLIAAIAVASVTLVTSDSAALLAAFCIGLAMVAVFRFEWFFYTQIFLLPWYPFLNVKVGLRDISLVLRFVLLVGVFILRKQSGKSLAQWFVGTRIKKGILIFAGLLTATLLVSSVGPNVDALRSLARMFSYVAFFYAIAGWVETREQLENVIKLILFSGILVALFGFYQVWQRGYTDLYNYLYPLQEQALEEWNGRITSLLFHFNSLAGYLNLILPFSLASMVLARERWLRYVAVACHSMVCAALYFTGSRGGLIAYAGMVLVSIYFLTPRRVAISRVLLATVLSAVIVIPLQPEAAAESRLQEVDESTSVSRLALWGAAGAMFLQHPVLGVGYGNYRSLYNDYIPGMEPNQLDAHNLYLQFLAETGIVGFLAFCILIVSLIRAAIKLARSSDRLYRVVGIGMGGALAATLMHGMVDFLFNVSPQFGALFWLVMALGLVALKQSSRSREDHDANRL